jgi:general secretion pathway protein H
MSLRSAGFTLIELTLVLFIVVLGFSAIAISIAGGNPSARLKSSAVDMVSALRYARGQALISRQEVAVAVDLTENNYRLSNRDRQYHIDDEIEVTMVIAQDELENDEIGHIRFYPDGSSSGGRITLDWGEFSRQIDINWLTGRVEQQLVDE